MNVELDELIKKTEEYLNSGLAGQKKSMAEMVLRELLKVKEDDNYVIPTRVTFSLMDSFDWSTEYWKKYLSIYWKNNQNKFAPIN